MIPWQALRSHPGRFQLDPVMLPAKLYYFFSIAAFAALTPFLPLHYRNLGLNGQQIGMLGALTPFVSLLSGPVWAGIADARMQHRRILIVATMMGLLTAVALMLAPNFAWLVPIVGLRACLAAPVTPLIDQSVLDMLGERKALYGRQRMWGAVGWSLASFVVGVLTERLGLHWAFYVYLVLAGIALLVMLRLPISAAVVKHPYWQGLRLLLANRHWALFLLAIFASGTGSSAGFNFLFLHLSDLGASRVFMGLMMTIGALSELPTFFFANVLLDRWGPRGLLRLSMGASLVRMLALATMRVPWPLLLVQLLYGPAFSALWSGGVAYAHSLAPEGMGATAQALFGAVSMGLAHMAGAALGGAIYDQLGGHTLFLIGGGLVAVGLFFFSLASRDQISLD